MKTTKWNVFSNIRTNGWLRTGVVVSAFSLALTLPGSGNAADTILKVGSTSYPTSLDPATSGGGSDHPYLYLIYDRLVDADRATGTLKPGLATSWKFSDDGRQLEMELRQGVQFHDGTPFNADAVLASIKRYQQKRVQTDLDIVTDVKVVEPHKVILMLKNPNSSLPAILADRGGMIVSPTAVQKHGDQYPRFPSGTGPYKVAAAVQGASVTYSRFDQYWAGKPALDGVNWVTFTEVIALENAATTGQLHVALQIPARDVSALQGGRGYTVSSGPSLEVTLMMLNGSKSPVDSKAVRSAINRAINRDDILIATNNGAGAVASQLLPPNSPYYSKEVAENYGYNLDEAKRLMKESGKTNVTLECTFFAGLGYEIAGPLMIEDLAKIGVKLTLHEKTLAQGVADMAAGKLPCFFTRWTGRPDPSMTLFGAFDTRGYANYGKNDIGVDPLMDQMLATFEDTDMEKRVEIGKQIALLAAQDPLSIALVYQPAVVLLSDKVEGYIPNYLGKQDLRSVSLRQ